jgi:hypothetical protein
MKISSRPPAMAGAVVPAQLCSGRPRESGTHRAANSGLWNIGPRLRGDDTRWLSAALAAGPFVSSLHLDPPSRCPVSFHVHLRLVFTCRLPRRFRIAGRCPSLVPPPNEGRRSAGAGHWHSRRACEAQRLASRATGGRLSALHVAIFGRRTDASSSGSAHRNRAATSPTAGHNVPTARSRASRGRGSLRRLRTPLPAAPSGRHRRRPARAR